MRFRGAVLPSMLHPGLPFGQMTVDVAACTMTSMTGRTWVVERDTTERVVYEESSSRLFRHYVAFVGVGGRSLRPVFVPLRPRRVRAALVEQGWPVEHLRRGRHVE